MSPSTIRYVGDDEYHSQDGDRSISLQPGQTAEVSDEKAAQLRSDRPDDFDVDDDEGGSQKRGGVFALGKRKPPPDDEIWASDRARDFAAENGVVWGDVTGTGANGLRKKSDVEAVIEARNT